ncbi:hypothetical protein B0H19DRAFT_1308661 [Mycena capillaripes]|nr:hypothetical protein B0H19DRAFT_1308661 [Mycena capillaripes]
MSTSPSGSAAKHSTPMRPSSRSASRHSSQTASTHPSQTASQENPKTPRSDRVQKELMNVMKNEIGTQAWEFKDATRISRILSPKTPIPGRDHRTLEDYQCDVDDPKFKVALNEAQSKLEPEVPIWKPTSDERQHYDDIENFLNACVEHGSASLGKHKLRGTWYKDLTFVRYDKEMGDGIDRAHPLKPDLGGVNDRKPAETLYWSPPDGSEGSRMQIPVEVKNDWTKMVLQAATYGRSLFSANPSRIFALVIAINHKEKNLRFLIFHRGGLTSHARVQLNNSAGRTDALRLIMTLLLWSKPQHAGFMSTCNEAEYLVPLATHHIKATVKKVIHDSACVRGRATRVSRLSCPPETPAAAAPDAPVFPVDLAPTTQATVLRRSQRLRSPPNTQSPPIPPPNPPSLTMSRRSQKGSKAKVSGGNNSTETGETRARAIRPHSAYPKYDLEWSSPSGLTPGEGSLTHGQDFIVKASWQIDSRKDTERDMYAAAVGAFGTPTVLCSYEGSHPNGEPISNRLFLPTSEEVQADRTLHWHVFAPDDGTVSPEVRTMCFTVFLTIGKSFLEAKSSYEICMALVHALLGWLSYYQSGFMHRDISIGNVLLVEGEAVSDRPFSIQAEISTSLWPPAPLDATTAALGNMAIEESGTPSKFPAHFAEEIRILVANLGIKDKFIAFTTDGDMAAKWKTYFDNQHNLETRSGTREFMSLQLQSAMETNATYIQSPIDDIQSFFWLAVWAVLFNDKLQEPSSKEAQWRSSLISGDYEKKATFTSELAASDFERGYSAVGTQLLPILQLWWSNLQTLFRDWRRVLNKVEYNEISQQEVSNFYKHHFHLYALRGVKEFLVLVDQNRETLMGYGEFPSS